MAGLSSMETMFKALSDKTRLRILGLLVDGELCVCRLHESLELPQPAVSRHLASLRRAGLVESRKEGLWVYYRLAEPEDAVLGTIVSTVTHCATHVGTIAKDRHRLHRTASPPVRSVSKEPTLACCQ